MKIQYLILCSVYLVCESIYAADGSINFTGRVFDNACVIDSDSSSLVVTLPTVSTNRLKAEGDVSGRTPFKINISNCTAANITAYFEPGPNIDVITGRLTNQAKDGAKNISIQLLSKKGAPILILPMANLDSNEFEAIKVPTGTDKSKTTLYYSAEYYATGAVTAGPVSATVQYTIIYK